MAQAPTYKQIAEEVKRERQEGEPFIGGYRGGIEKHRVGFIAPSPAIDPITGKPLDTSGGGRGIPAPFPEAKPENQPSIPEQPLSPSVGELNKFIKEVHGEVTEGQRAQIARDLTKQNITFYQQLQEGIGRVETGQVNTFKPLQFFEFGEGRKLPEVISRENIPQVRELIPRPTQLLPSVPEVPQAFRFQEVPPSPSPISPEQEGVRIFHEIPAGIFIREIGKPERKATPEEVTEYYQLPSVLQAKETPKGVMGFLEAIEHKTREALGGILKKPEESIKEIKETPESRAISAGYRQVRYAMEEPFRVVVKNIFKGLEKVGLDEQKIVKFVADIPITPLDIPAEILGKRKLGASFREEVILGEKKMLEERPLRYAELYYGAKAVGVGVGIAREVVMGRGILPSTAEIVRKVLGLKKPSELIGEVRRGAIATGLTGLVGFQVMKEVKGGLAEGRTPAQVGAGVFGTLRDIGIVGIGYAKGVKFVEKPIVTREVPQNMRNMFAELQIQKRDIEGKIKTFGTQTIIQKVIPRKQEISTKFREMFGIEPIRKLALISKPFFQIPIKTLEPSVVGEPFVALGRFRRVKTISTIEGIAIPADLLTLYPKRLPPLEKKLVEKVLELPPKRLPPLEKIMKRIKKDAQYTFGEVLSEKEIRLARKQKIDLKAFIEGRVKEGRKTERAKYLSEVEELPTPEGFPYEFFITRRMRFKSTTEPLARAAGEFPKMEGITIRYKPIIDVPYALEPKLELPIKITKTEFSVERKFKEPRGELPDISKEKALEIVKTLKGIYRERPPARITQRDILGYEKSVKRLQTYFKGLSREELKSLSEIYRERPRGVIADLKMPEQKIPLKMLPKPIPPKVKEIPPSKVIRELLTERVKTAPILRIKEKARAREVLREITRVKEPTRVRDVLLPRTRLKLRELAKVRERLIEKEKALERSIEKLIPREREVLRIRELQRQKPRLQQKLLERQRIIPKTTTIPPPIIVPRIKIPSKFIIPKFSLEQRMLKGLGKKAKAFDVVIIEKKKPRLVARGLPRETALDIGARAVFKGLRATFALRESDLLAGDIETAGEFKKYRELFREPTKRSPLRSLGEAYVQKQTRTRLGRGRLTFKGEIAEIQEARMRKMVGVIR